MENPLDDNTAISYWMYEIVKQAPEHLPFKLVDILPKLDFNDYERKQYKRLIPDLERQMLVHSYLLKSEKPRTFTLPPYIKNYEDLIINGYPLTDYSKTVNSTTTNHNQYGDTIIGSHLGGGFKNVDIRNKNITNPPAQNDIIINPIISWMLKHLWIIISGVIIGLLVLYLWAKFP